MLSWYIFTKQFFWARWILFLRKQLAYLYPPTLANSFRQWALILIRQLVGLGTHPHPNRHLDISNVLGWRSLGKQQRQEGHWSSNPSPFFPETVHRTPKWMVLSLYQEGRHFYHQRAEFRTKKPIQTNLVKPPLSFLVTLYHLLSLVQTPLAWPHFTNLLLLCLKCIQTSRSGHCFGISFSWEGSNVHVKHQE